MASVQPVDSNIGAGLAPFSISSNKGPDTIHLSPFQSHKNNKSLGPAEASIQEGFATNRISSGSDSRASRVEPEVPESAPAESTPGTSGKSHSMFAVMKNLLLSTVPLQNHQVLQVVTKAGTLDSKELT